MKLPDYPIEMLWDTMNETDKERFPGLLYDGRGRLWFFDGFAGVFVKVQHAENDIAGWVPGEIVHYAREIGCLEMALTDDEILCGAANFARPTSKQPNIESLVEKITKALEQNSGIQFVLDLKRLAPLIAFLNESAQASAHRTVMCRVKQEKENEPCAFETRLDDMGALLMPMRIGIENTLSDTLIPDDDGNDDRDENW